MSYATPSIPKVLFYIERDLHLPFLEPIFDWLQAHSSCQLAFCAPAYRDSHEGQPGVGLPLEQLQRLAAKGHLADDPHSFRPDVIVCADACTHLLGAAKLVFVGHGIISKGAFYTTSPVVRRENLADLICVPGPLHKEILEKNVFSPIVVTGFIKSDQMFAAGTPDRAGARRLLGLPAQGRVVLYAPTYNPEMSSLYVLGEQVADLCRDDDLFLLVKLHTMTDRAVKERFRRLAQDHPRLRYCEDIDVTPAMLAADLLITDVSSVMAEFMFLDRPVIVVDNPRLSEFPLYIADDIEYRVRDAATIRVATFAELKSAVRRSCDNPQELSHRRHVVADALCFGRDGKAAERCGRAILDLLQQPTQTPVASCTVVIDWPFVPPDKTAAEFEAQLCRDNPEVILQILHSHRLRQPTGSAAWFDDIAANADGEYLVLLQPGERFPGGWIKRLILHQRWSGTDAVVQPLSSQQDLPRLIGRFLPTDISKVEPRRIAAVLFQGLCGFQEPATEYHDRCLLLQRWQLQQLIGAEAAFAQDRLRQLPRVQALDTLSWPEQLLPANVVANEPQASELISIIIPLFNNVELTARCLETLFQHTPQGRYELVLVDNGSTDRTGELLEIMPATVRIIRNSSNVGFARACNQGAQAARGGLLLFLNNDTELLPHWLEPLLETIASDPGIAAVGPKLLFPDGTIQHAGVVIVDNRVNRDPLCGVHIWHGMAADTPDANVQRDFKVLTAACLLIRRQDFHDVGGFDEGYWNGYEDVDLCFKLLQRGRRLVYEPRSVLIHHESKSGPERFAKVDANIRRLHERWLGRIRPDIRINPDSVCEWLDQSQ